MAEPALSLDAVGKQLDGKVVLDRVSLELARGELVAILGASGAGKTTLLRLIAGLDDVDAGRIRLDGHVVADAKTALPPEARHLGYLAQEGALFPHLSVADNIAFGLNVSRRERKQLTAKMLALVNLPSAYIKRYPHQLSGGEQQRVALARALAPGPRLVLLDEPFAALDSALRVEIRAAVLAALEQVGAAGLLVTHDPAEAMSMGDRVAVLMHGQIAQCDNPMTLYRHPVNPAVGRFVGDAVIVEGHRRGSRIVCALGSLTPDRKTADNEPLEVLIRPEQIGLVADGTTGSVTAEVVSVDYFGRDALVALRLRETHDTVLARVFSHAIPAPGDRVGIAVTGEVCIYPSAAGAAASEQHGELPLDAGNAPLLRRKTISR